MKYCLVSEIKTLGNFSAVVIDAAVERLYSDRLQLENCIIVEGGESAKTLDGAKMLWDAFLRLGIERSGHILCIGGGAISDLAGFAAACYMRGIKISHAPTTLLGMVDAAVGGKTAVNFNGIKNLIGAFHHPQSIFLCPEFLDTLPEREFRAGLAEVIKYGMVRDAEFFEFLERHIDRILLKKQDVLKSVVERCCALKKEIVSFDEKEGGVRAILNYGHTFAHAIESATHYRLLHGEAVAIGMSLAASLSGQYGFCDGERQDALLLKSGLPVTAKNIPVNELMRLMKKDKKSQNGKNRLILAEKIGKVFVCPDVDDKLIERTLTERMN